MSTYALTGTGVQALSANVTAVHVSITTPPAQSYNGSAHPANYYHVALLRFGDTTGYFDAVPVVGGPQWMAVPSGSTQLGYACQGNAAISVAEVIGGTPPFGGSGALSSLSDVSLASPTDTQVLTYQASSSRWINANAPSGSGGALTYFEDKLASDVVMNFVNTEYTIITRSLVAGTWLLFAEVVSYNAITTGHNVAARIYSGTTLLKSAYMSASFNSVVPSTALFAIAVLSSTTSIT